MLGFICCNWIQVTKQIKTIFISSAQTKTIYLKRTKANAVSDNCSCSLFVECKWNQLTLSWIISNGCDKMCDLEITQKNRVCSLSFLSGFIAHKIWKTVQFKLNFFPIDLYLFFLNGLIIYEFKKKDIEKMLNWLTLTRCHLCRRQLLPSFTAKHKIKLITVILFLNWFQLKYTLNGSSFTYFICWCHELGLSTEIQFNAMYQ